MDARKLVSTDASRSREPHPHTSRSLTTKLPFDDDEFDHVHIKSIARGVPENKVCIHTHMLRRWLIVLQWQTIFEEVNRVLCPGGVLELVEEGESLRSSPLPCRSQR